MDYRTPSLGPCSEPMGRVVSSTVTVQPGIMEPHIVDKLFGIQRQPHPKYKAYFQRPPQPRGLRENGKKYTSNKWI